MVAGDAVLESNMASSSLRDRSYIEHNTGSVKADDLQGAGQTAPVINTPVFDEAPLLTAESSGQTLTSVTVSASSLPNIGENDPVINISCFMTAKILNKRLSPFRVEYRCELKPVWLSSVLVKEIPMGGVRIRSYKNGLIRADRLGTLRDRKRKHSQI
jgi:DNA-directed RNA polymerase subunit H (RpoH/RPB5)